MKRWLTRATGHFIFLDQKFISLPSPLRNLKPSKSKFGLLLFFLFDLNILLHLFFFLFLSIQSHTKWSIVLEGFSLGIHTRTYEIRNIISSPGGINSRCFNLHLLIQYLLRLSYEFRLPYFHLTLHFRQLWASILISDLNQIEETSIGIFLHRVH